jgi:hypothetical protein
LTGSLGIPHKEKKQIFGSPLPVLGINVDANCMTLTLPDKAKFKLIDELKWWSEKGKKEKVKYWYQMGGWINWGLSTQHLPALTTSPKQFLPKVKRTTTLNITNMGQQQYTQRLQMGAPYST